MMVFFDSDRCVKCGESLGFRVDALEMIAVKKSAATESQPYRDCENRKQHNLCNWLVPTEDHDDFCLSCRLNDVIPDLTVEGNSDRWYKLELAKRRCLYTLLRLGLPVETGSDPNIRPLRFRFLGDVPNAPAVLTGHDNGVITINIAEADGDERERRRLRLHEPYRTLVGHIRHETGHYYWDRFIANSPQLSEFRALFGDETTDYQAALEKYYREGPAKDWPDRTVTAYASLHPWEDWAETWAHYLHIADTLETAGSFGLTLIDGKQGAANFNFRASSIDPTDFDHMLAKWLPLTCALNSINRGMGLQDLYPFVITDAAIEKLRFVHKLIQKEGKKSRSGVSRSLPHPPLPCTTQ